MIARVQPRVGSGGEEQVMKNWAKSKWAAFVIVFNKKKHHLQIRNDAGLTLSLQTDRSSYKQWVHFCATGVPRGQEKG